MCYLSGEGAPPPPTSPQDKTTSTNLKVEVCLDRPWDCVSEEEGGLAGSLLPRPCRVCAAGTRAAGIRVMSLSQVHLTHLGMLDVRHRSSKAASRIRQTLTRDMRGGAGGVLPAPDAPRPELQPARISPLGLPRGDVAQVPPSFQPTTCFSAH